MPPVVIIHQGRRLGIHGADAFDRFRESPVGSQMFRLSDGRLLATRELLDLDWAERLSSGSPYREPTLLMTAQHNRRAIAAA